MADREGVFLHSVLRGHSDEVECLPMERSLKEDNVAVV